MRTSAYAILLSCLLPTAAAAGDLTITVEGLKDASGSVLGGLYDSQASYMNPAAAHARFKLKAAAGQIQYVVHGLAAGQYALSVFHDSNDNGKLDRNAQNVPTEGYGFSNDAQGSGGPPSFDQAHFKFDGGNAAITVTIDE